MSETTEFDYRTAQWRAELANAKEDLRRYRIEQALAEKDMAELREFTTRQERINHAEEVIARREAGEDA